MKRAPAVILGAIVLAGCQHEMTLEEARAQCTKQGGFLVVFYTQKVTTAGVGPPVATPGNCVSPGNFKTAPATPPTSGAAVSGNPASGPPASGAPAAGKSPAPVN